MPLWANDMPYSGRRQLQLGIWLAALLICLGLGPTTASAQFLRPGIREPFLSSPLEDDPRDPLLPDPPIQRPLSPLEKLALEADLDRLAATAAELFANGQSESAYELWMREVRLRRLLGLNQELTAIERVGQLVWDAGRSQEVRLLTARLEVIRADLQAPPVNMEPLQRVADLFALLGEAEEAIATYQQLADISQKQGQPVQHQTYLETIAQIQRRWFKFLEAALTYQELYALEVATPEDKILYLQRVADSYSQVKQFQQALEAQQVLLQFYQWQRELSPIPALRLSMGEHHQALNQLEAASQQYQRAYEQAIAIPQFAIASQSLKSLAQLYQQVGRDSDRIYLYQQLILVERASYSAFGVMFAYDQLGQTYEDLNQPEMAIEAYRQGLAIAEQLNHRQQHFRAQIRRLSPDDIQQEGWRR